MNTNTILITGAGSGFGRLAAFGLAQRGHRVIATTHIWPQVTELRNEARVRKLELDVDKLDVTSALDRKNALRWDIDGLISNAGTMEVGPIAEQPMELVRAMFDVNFFYSLELAQGFARKMVAKRSGKIVFTSSMGGLWTVPYGAGYCASKHALEAVAEGLKTELAPFGVKVATVNPGILAPASTTAARRRSAIGTTRRRTLHRPKRSMRSGICWPINSIRNRWPT